MDLKISYNWLKEYVKTSKSLNDVVSAISLKSQTIDRVKNPAEGLGGVVVGKMLEISKHPNADKLHVAKVDIGKSRPLQLIFGQVANLKVGDKLPIAVAPTVLPGGKAIKSVEMRGVISHGMCCLDSELGLSDQDRVTFFPEDVKPGTSIVKALGLDDYILNVEVTSNRPDAMSVIGLAREAAAVIGGKLLIKKPALKVSVRDTKPLRVTIQDKKRCLRYQAAVLTNIHVEPSPLWMQQRLLSAGKRPINNVVDITNYILLEYGQPMHVFDYDQIQGSAITVRRAQRGESIVTLDNATYELTTEDVVIADAEKPVAIAGVIGGSESASVEKTVTIVFEAATFDAVSVRRTSRRLNIRTDSSNLFEKKLSPMAPELAMLRAIELAQQLAGGTVASKIIDVNPGGKQKTKVIIIKKELIARYLGIEISPTQIKKMLAPLGFGISGANIMRVTVPWWRNGDVEYDYDLVEEIARLYGFQRLPVSLPVGQLTGAAPDQTFVWEDRAKDVLVGLGFIEVYNYSMVSSAVFAKAGLEGRKAVRIANPLNADMEYMRTDLYPGLLQNIADNTRWENELRLFELSNVYLVSGARSLPIESARLSGVVAGTDGEALFSLGKGAIELLLRRLGVAGYKLAPPDFKSPLWEQNTALNVTVGGKFVGRFGLVNKKILNAFGIKVSVALFDADFSALVGLAKTSHTFQPLPTYPSVVRDVAFVVDRTLPWAMLEEQAKAVDPLIISVEYQNTFYHQSIGDNKKSIALRLTCRDEQRTLRSEEVDAVIQKVVDVFTSKFGAIIR